MDELIAEIKDIPEDINHVKLTETLEPILNKISRLSSIKGDTILSEIVAKRVGLKAHELKSYQKTLKEFPGTLIFVSHDRFFIDRLATHVWEMVEVRIKVYQSNFHDF